MKLRGMSLSRMVPGPQARGADRHIASVLERALQARGIPTSESAQGQMQRMVEVTDAAQGAPMPELMCGLILLTQGGGNEYGLFEDVRSERLVLVRGLANGIAYNVPTMGHLGQVFHTHPRVGLNDAQPSGADTVAAQFDPTHGGCVVTIDGWVAPYELKHVIGRGGATSWAACATVAPRYNLLTGARAPPPW